MMTERERWIVYPLLFLALGASIRDKVLREVQTSDLRADEIRCKSLVVLDKDNPRRVVARITSESPSGGAEQDRFGMLLLIDSQGKELCSVTNNNLVVRGVVCESVSVVDPARPDRALAQLGAASVNDPNGQSRRLGRLLLTDSDGREMFGLADDFLQMRNVRCESVTISDPSQPQRVLAQLASATVQAKQPGAPAQRVGVLALNNQQYVQVLGLPKPAVVPVKSAPPEPVAAPAPGPVEAPAPGPDQSPASPSDQEATGQDASPSAESAAASRSPEP
jgi:hypothetical protein